MSQSVSLSASKRQCASLGLARKPGLYCRPDSTIRKRFPSMSPKKNCGGTGSPMVTSVEMSPVLRFPLRAMPETHED